MDSLYTVMTSPQEDDGQFLDRLTPTQDAVLEQMLTNAQGVVMAQMQEPTVSATLISFSFIVYVFNQCHHWKRGI